MKLTYEDKVGLTLACLNNKKLVKMIVGKNCYFIQISTILLDFERIKCEYKKDKYQKRCLSSLLLWSCGRLELYPLFPKIFGKIHLLLGKT